MYQMDYHFVFILYFCFFIFYLPILILETSEHYTTLVYGGAKK